MQAPKAEKEANIDFSGVPIEALESLRLRLTQVSGNYQWVVKVVLTGENS